MTWNRIKNNLKFQIKNPKFMLLNLFFSIKEIITIFRHDINYVALQLVILSNL